MTSEKMQQLQMLEQGLQSFAMQKQQLQSKLMELDTALAELGKTEVSYKIIGNVMVKAEQGNLVKELEQSKQHTEVRIKTVENQELAMREKAKKLQEEVVAQLKEDGSKNNKSN